MCSFKIARPTRLTKKRLIHLLITLISIEFQQTTLNAQKQLIKTTLVTTIGNQRKAPLASQNLLLFQANDNSPLVQAQQLAEVPDFDGPIGNHTVALGKDAQLSCKIKNLGNYRTAWLRVEDKGILTIHNNIITRNYRVGLLNNDNGRNFILTIKNVQPSDKGGYMCQINSVPMKYAIGYLDVLTPPAFDDSSPSQTPQTTTLPSTIDQDSSQASDQSATTGVSGKQQSQVTVSEGSNATLSCRAHGHPAPVITWRREDGQPILLNGVDHSDESLTNVEGSSLIFNSAHRLNSGAYLCIAANGVQPSASKRLVLDVQFSPVITLPQIEVSASLNQPEAKLECLVELNPLGTYHWIKLNGQSSQEQLGRSRPNAQEDDLWLIEHDELMQSDKYEIVIKQMTSEKVQMILNIRQIEKKDFSWYKCIAKNSLGIQSNSIRFYESSSFSLNNMFRGSGTNDDNNNSLQMPSDENNNNNNNNNNLQMNDESIRTKDIQLGVKPQVLANQQQPRPHTRSSWIQRSSGSSVRQVASGGAHLASSAGNLLFSSLLINCLVAIYFRSAQFVVVN